MLDLKGWSYDNEGNLIKPCGTICSHKGLYRRVSIKKKDYYQHRIIFFLAYGYWAKEIDHIDQNKHNNRPSNLREVKPTTNLHNRGTYRNNTSGIKGVRFDSKKSSWEASWSAFGKRNRRYFPTKEQAVACRQAWEFNFNEMPLEV